MDLPVSRFITGLARFVKITARSLSAPDIFDPVMERDISDQGSTILPSGMTYRLRGSLQVGVILFVLMVTGLWGCKHEPLEAPADELGGGGGGPIFEEEVPCDPNVVYFQQQVLPILISNCAIPGCHNAPNEDNDDIVLTSYSSVMDPNTDVVRPNDLGRDLYESITDDDVDDRMPQDRPALSASDIAIIRNWILQGAQNTSCESSVCDTLNVTYSGTIRPLVQQRCQGCHSGSSPQGGLDFSVWGPLNLVASDGRLAGAIQHQATYINMPPSGPMLPDCRIQQFLLWIGDGAPNN